MLSFTDPNLTHGQRCVAWSMMQEGVVEEPPGSNRGPEISGWLRMCQRDGYGPEFGEHLARHGANWCAAFACAADRAARIESDPPAVHGYRASGLELENDARAVGAWRDAALVLEGSWSPAVGDLVVWRSGDGSAGQAWRRHVARFIKREQKWGRSVAEGALDGVAERERDLDVTAGGTFLAVGGNEVNRVNIEGGRHFNSPLLLGFIELPRAAADPIKAAVNVEVLKRAADLQSRLWRGVVGMDAFDELLKELDATDPTEW